MNKQKVVAELIVRIERLRSQGRSKQDVHQSLVQEGWAIGAVGEAMAALHEEGGHALRKAETQIPVNAAHLRSQMPAG